MTKDNNKVTIKYKDKEYEIEKTEDEQKDIKPKGGKDVDKGITVKNYEKGGFFTSHSCECSEDGTNFEKIKIKWGAKKHITIWGGGSVLLIGAFLTIYWSFFKKKKRDVSS